MGQIRITEDILSLTELRARLTEKIERLHQGSGQLIVTRNGRPAAVILSPERFDRLQYESFVRAKLAGGLSDAVQGRAVPHESVMTEARRLADAEAEEES